MSTRETVPVQPTKGNPMFYVKAEDFNSTGLVFTVASEPREGLTEMDDFRDSSEYGYLPPRSKKQLATWVRSLGRPSAAAVISVKR